MKLLRLLFVPSVLLLVFSPALRPSSQQSSPKKTKSSGQPAAKASTSKSTPKQSASRKGSSKSSKSKSAASRAPQTQRQPDEQRIREIQEALNAKGYPVESNGVWGPDSVEALKKFQQDQNINNLSGRGKLDSLTLIALGLGPQREPAPGSPPPPAVTEGKQE
ncbi:MAG: peptidoglycan-binding protein [Acidobacteria bacterium]|nr:peptidoglycan-binding protein [Acidobacteriota bacterium]